MKYNNKESIGEDLKLLTIVILGLMGIIIFIGLIWANVKGYINIGIIAITVIVIYIIFYYIYALVGGFGQLVTNSDRIVKLLEEQKNKEENSKQENNK